MNIVFESVFERDIDILLMHQFVIKNEAFISAFFEKIGINTIDYQDVNISHSVMTADGETDIEVIFVCNNKRIALLIEDKISATAQRDQAARYKKRAAEAKKLGKYDDYYIFIAAPKKYLENNEEAGKYTYNISYEEIKDTLTDVFDLAILDRALEESKSGYIPIVDRRVSLFWKRMIEFAEEKYPNVFLFYAK